MFTINEIETKQLKRLGSLPGITNGASNEVFETSGDKIMRAINPFKMFNFKENFN